MRRPINEIVTTKLVRAQTITLYAGQRYSARVLAKQANMSVSEASHYIKQAKLQKDGWYMRLEIRPFLLVTRRYK